MSAATHGAWASAPENSCSAGSRRPIRKISGPARAPAAVRPKNDQIRRAFANDSGQGHAVETAEGVEGAC